MFAYNSFLLANKFNFVLKWSQIPDSIFLSIYCYNSIFEQEKLASRKKIASHIKLPQLFSILLNLIQQPDLLRINNQLWLSGSNQVTTGMNLAVSCRELSQTVTSTLRTVFWALGGLRFMITVWPAIKRKQIKMPSSTPPQMSWSWHSRFSLTAKR